MQSRTFPPHHRFGEEDGSHGSLRRGRSHRHAL
jgi:hypothetical protein